MSRKTEVGTKVLGLVALLLAVGCGTGDDDDDTLAGDDDTTAADDDDTPADDDDTTPADDDDTGDDDTGDDDDSAVDEDPCAPLPPPSGNIVVVGPGDAESLIGIGYSLAEGDTLLLQDGEYHLNGAYLWLEVPGITVRSESGDCSAVVLDGDYVSQQIIRIGAADITVADVTLKRTTTHPIHVSPPAQGPSFSGTRIHNVHVIDPMQQAIKINPYGEFTADEGEVSCSRLELTAEGRPHVDPVVSGCYTGGVDGHEAWGWHIHDNHIEGFWCPTGLSEHGIHMWSGCRDTVVERNVLVDNTRGIGFGMYEVPEGRVYADDPCPGVAIAGHYGGVIRNNAVVGRDPDLFASASGFDVGISVNQSCDVSVLHNTVATTEEPYISIEYRFEDTSATITNNLVTKNIRQRDDAQAVLDGNLEYAPTTLFTDVEGADLHLLPTATDAIDQGVAIAAGACDEDMDRQVRGAARDIGADETNP